MAQGNEIVIGDKVDLMTLHSDVIYKTIINDIGNGGLFYVPVPSYGGIPMSVHTDDELVMVFYRESGRFICMMKVVDFEVRDEIRFVLMAQTSQAEKDQRRRFYRLPVILEVVICEYAGDMETDLSKSEMIAKAVALEVADSRDLSVTGISLLTKHNYARGDKFVLKLFFDEKAKKDGVPFVICAEVVRNWLDEKNNMYRIGMQFFAQNQSMSEYLAKFVLKQQQKQVIRRRLIEDI